MEWTLFKTRDGDNDGFIHDGTPRQRPAGFDDSLFEFLSGRPSPRKRVRTSRVGNIESERLAARRRYLLNTKRDWAPPGEGKKRVKERAHELGAIERELLRRELLTPAEASLGTIPSTQYVAMSPEVAETYLDRVVRVIEPSRPGSDKKAVVIVDMSDIGTEERIGLFKRKREAGTGPNPKSTPKEVVGSHGHRSHGKSILWPALYEHLRAKGYSKEKSARISNAAWNRKRGMEVKNIPSTRLSKSRPGSATQDGADVGSTHAVSSSESGLGRAVGKKNDMDPYEIEKRWTDKARATALLARRRRGWRSLAGKQTNDRLAQVLRRQAKPRHRLKTTTTEDRLVNHTGKTRFHLTPRQLKDPAIRRLLRERVNYDIVNMTELMPQAGDHKRALEVDEALDALAVLTKRRVWVKGFPGRRAHWRSVKGGADPKTGFTALDDRLLNHKNDRPLDDEKATTKFKKLVEGSSYKAYSQAPFLDALHSRMGVKDPMKHPVDDYMERRAKVFKKQPTETIKLSDITATQKTVHMQRVLEMAATGQLGSDTPLQVVRHGGKNYLLDGHHRVAAKAVRGDTKIKANVLDLDALDREIKALRRSQMATPRTRRQVGLVSLPISKALAEELGLPMDGNEAE